MLTIERHQFILNLLNKNGRVTTDELCEQLGVSPATIRNDLNKLEAEKLLHKIYGGALPIDANIMSTNAKPAVYNFHNRSHIHSNEKNAISKLALEQIQEGQCIILDASSTCVSLANKLSCFSRLTVVTNGVYTMLALKEIPNITVMLIGGIVTKNSGSTEGLLGADLLNNINADIAFVSAHGFSLNQGLTDFNVYEVALKEKMLTRSKHTIALLDYSKLDNISTTSFAGSRDVDMIITDSKADSSMIEKYQKNGISVQVAQI